MRDSYRKSLGKTKAAKKSGSGVVKVKAYVYSSQLQFLDKIFQERNTEDTLSQNIDDCGDEDAMVETGENPVEQVPSTSSDGAAEKPKSPFKKPVTKKRKMDPVELEMISALREPVNRHLSFFKGLLPSLEDFNEFDTIDFQMEVLKIVKNIRERKCQQQTQPVYNQHHPPLCSSSVSRLQTEPQISAGQYYEKTAHYLSSPNPSYSSHSVSDDSSDYLFNLN